MDARAIWRSVGVCVLLLATAPAYAQIYQCVDENGAKVFSDEKCGPDAKVVPGLSSRKRSHASAPAAPRKPRTVGSPEELETLSESCDAGDMKACREWTMSGGPDHLRTLERQAELDCEAGSLTACEQRYCRDRMDEDCRLRVLRTAKLAGESWYLRAEEEDRPGGVTHYFVRCATQGETQIRDLTVSCRTLSGPDRCSVRPGKRAFPRLDLAAQARCGAPAAGSL